MKIFFNINPLLLAFMLLPICAACQSNDNSTEMNPPSDPAKVLIVYLSRTNNTEAVAKIIQQQVGGTLVELELVNPYPEDYQEIVAQVDQENETDFLPELKTEVDNIDQYEMVFVGFPTWDMQLPPPMKSFLTQYDLSGKTIVPFNTNAGYGIGSSFDKVEELCPNSTVLEGFSTRGGIERDGVLFVMEGEKEKEVQGNVREWLIKIGDKIK